MRLWCETLAAWRRLLGCATSLRPIKSIAQKIGRSTHEIPCIQRLDSVLLLPSVINAGFLEMDGLHSGSIVPKGGVGQRRR
ncbi:hypothetical protein BD311DRAFT_769775, partial [Dichomitus squalens]|uniref:Uncharacterized protein n=1 Tax=Dichomitus squalens TaxID=114155 RepID=A0A4Q9M4E6_9APHY